MHELELPIRARSTKARRPSGETLSAPILSALQTQYPEVKTGGWRRAVRAALSEHLHREGIPQDFNEMVEAFRFEPDAYVVNAEEAFVHFFEVEVYNPMTAEKLRSYGRLMIDMEFHGIEFAVLVVNKYGHINTVDLLPYYAESLRAAAHPC